MHLSLQSEWVCAVRSQIWFAHVDTTNGTPFFFAKLLKLCQVVRGSSVKSPFQVQLQILYWIEIWALTRPLQNIHIIVFKPCRVAFTVRFRSLSCWKIILISSHNLLHLFYPVPLQIYHCLLPPQCFLVGMVCLWWCAVEESPTCLWVNSRWALTSFLQQRFSLCHTPIKLWLSLSVQLLKLSTPSE